MITLNLTNEEGLFLQSLCDLWIEAEDITVDAIIGDMSLDMTELQEAAFHVSEHARMALGLKKHIDDVLSIAKVERPDG